jgi:hypothetical protein
MGAGFAARPLFVAADGPLPRGRAAIRKALQAAAETPFAAQNRDNQPQFAAFAEPRPVRCATRCTRRGANRGTGRCLR